MCLHVLVWMLTVQYDASRHTSRYSLLIVPEASHVDFRASDNMENVDSTTDFKFDFAIEKQAQDWQKLDDESNEPTESHQEAPESPLFFSYTNFGDEWFTVSDPKSVKGRSFPSSSLTAPGSTGDWPP
ncbi:hypothetical protein SprV_0301138600 [Sparganum proliferum]